MEKTVDSKFFENSDKTIYQALLDISKEYEDYYALGFYGRRITYRNLIENIDRVAKALIKAGVKKGDTVTFMLPNIPQAVYVYYAINRIGAIANMIHTLSAVDTIVFSVNKAQSNFIVTLNSFCEKAKEASKRANEELSIIFTNISDEMLDDVKLAFAKKAANDPLPDTDGCLYLNELIDSSEDVELPNIEYVPNSVATIFYSGGTTGTSKGICLSDKNINSMIVQQPTIVGRPIVPGKKFLSAMPLFHGYGLAFGLHAFMCTGFQCILLPQFDFDECIKIVIEEKINIMSVVPSLYEAFLRSDAFDGVDLSFFEGAFCGGDAVPLDLQRRFNAFLKEHNSVDVLREGYGLTESVAACIANPINDTRAGSIGVPLGDLKVRIVKPGTFEDLPDGERGEMIISGSAVMLGYLNDEEETKKVLKQDTDGTTWLYSGDMCYIDDGYVYFVQRIKRMIITSGYNVYPIEVERVINECNSVLQSCVIGIKNKLLGQIVAACVILNEGYDERESRKEIITACKKHLMAFEVPTKIIFVDKFPLTKVGKVDFMELQRIENEKVGFKRC